MGMDDIKRDLALKIDSDVNMPPNIMLAKAIIGTVAGVAATVGARMLVDVWVERQTPDDEDDFVPIEPTE